MVNLLYGVNTFLVYQRRKKQPLHGDDAMLYNIFWPKKKKTMIFFCEWDWEGGRGRVLWGDLWRRRMESGEYV